MQVQCVLYVLTNGVYHSHRISMNELAGGN